MNNTLRFRSILSSGQLPDDRLLALARIWALDVCSHAGYRDTDALARAASLKPRNELERIARETAALVLGTGLPSTIALAAQCCTNARYAAAYASRRGPNRNHRFKTPAEAANTFAWEREVAKQLADLERALEAPMYAVIHDPPYRVNDPPPPALLRSCYAPQP